MPSARNSVVIGRPIDQVFAFFADGENDLRWRPALRSVRREGEVGVGGVYRQTVAGPAGRPVAADIRITDFEPNRRIAFEGIAGPVRPRGVYTFVPEGDTSTEVALELSADLSGIRGLVLSGMVQKSMDSEVAALSRARSVLEGAP